MRHICANQYEYCALIRYTINLKPSATKMFSLSLSLSLSLFLSLSIYTSLSIFLSISLSISISLSHSLSISLSLLTFHFYGFSGETSPRICLSASLRLTIRLLLRRMFSRCAFFRLVAVKDLFTTRRKMILMAGCVTKVHARHLLSNFSSFHCRSFSCWVCLCVNELYIIPLGTSTCPTALLSSHTICKWIGEEGNWLAFDGWLSVRHLTALQRREKKGMTMRSKTDVMMWDDYKWWRPQGCFQVK